MYLLLTTLFVGTFIFSVCSPREQNNHHIKSAWNQQENLTDLNRKD
jgi:hypothetical protein